jgi:hypothetical protein
MSTPPKYITDSTSPLTNRFDPPWNSPIPTPKTVCEKVKKHREISTKTETDTK